MGWDFGWQSRRELVEFLQRTVEDEEVVWRTFAWAEPCAREAYAVTEVRGKQSGEVRRFASVYLIERNCHGWGYKAMDESMEPFYYACPLVFLDYLTEPRNEVAAQWRERVRAFHRDNLAAQRGEALTLTLPGCERPERFMTPVKEGDNRTAGAFWVCGTCHQMFAGDKPALSAGDVWVCDGCADEANEELTGTAPGCEEVAR